MDGTRPRESFCAYSSLTPARARPLGVFTGDNESCSRTNMQFMEWDGREGGRGASEALKEGRLGFHFVALVILSCLGVVPHDTTDRTTRAEFRHPQSESQ